MREERGVATASAKYNGSCTRTHIVVVVVAAASVTTIAAAIVAALALMDASAAAAADAAAAAAAASAACGLASGIATSRDSCACSALFVVAGAI